MTPTPDMRGVTAALDSPEYWSVELGGIHLSSSSMVVPGDMPYRVVCWTLCGREQATLDGGTRDTIPARQFTRRIRILVSLQHHLQNGCDECGTRLRSATTAAEREWLYCSDPSLGKILGFEERTA